MSEYFEAPNRVMCIPIRDMEKKKSSINFENTVELQWLEHLRDHGNIFERGVVQASVC